MSGSPARGWPLALGACAVLAGCAEAPTPTECAGDPGVCGTNAHCVDSWAGAFCVCDRGYQGDGVECDFTPARYRLVSAGVGHTCAIRTNGRLWCWGRNTYGQLGIDSVDSDQHPLPVPVGPRADDWSEVSANVDHTCAIRRDRTLWCWGDNSNGELGTDDWVSRSAPAEITGGPVWRHVSAGATHTCAIRLASSAARSSERRSPGAETGGELWCWGGNRYGELGVGYQEQLSPVQVGDAHDWSAVTAGTSHTCGLRDGELWCWGRNGDGRVGDGSFDNRSTPVRIGDHHDWTAVSAGRDHTCALRAGGQLWCWGANATGQVGDGSFAPWSQPYQLPGSSWSEVAAGSGFTCGRRDGRIWCWGQNNWGQLGRGDQVLASTPVDLGFAGAALATGRTHACAIAADDSLWCWGFNEAGRLGLGVGPSRSTPTRVGDQRFAAVRTGHAKSSCAIAVDDGALWCWGENTHGQLGDGTYLPRQVPAPVASTLSFRAIALGWWHSCAIALDDDSLWCWGGNGDGQLGNGTNQGATAPVQVGDGGDWLQVSAVGWHTCAIRLAPNTARSSERRSPRAETSGSLWCWGDNSRAQLGDDTTEDHNAPIQIGDASDYTQVATTRYHTCALRAGSIWCWGGGDPTPVRVEPDPGWVAIATNDWGNLCALRDDHTLWCAAIGNPLARVDDAADWTAVRGACARRADSTVWCDLDRSPPRPRQLAGTGWADFADGGDSWCAVDDDGALYCWGAGDSGQLGTGDAWSLAPALTAP